jgi:hypothetical protein
MLIGLLGKRFWFVVQFKTRSWLLFLEAAMEGAKYVSPYFDDLPFAFIAGIDSFGICFGSR